MIGKCNPLNIRTSAYFKWAGQTGETRGFCDFEDVTMCRRAGAYLLMRSYRRCGITKLRDVIHRFAPAVENDTDAYISFVCKRTEFKPYTELVFDSDFAAVLAAMEIFEQGVHASMRDGYYFNAKASYIYVINQFNLRKYEIKG